MNIQTVTNALGRKSAVLIPFKEWESIQNKISKLEHEQKVLLGIKDAMNEVKSIISGKKKGKSLASFLNEI
ncbi:MAG: hypothetical protein RIQ33_441 [Bacteroidota bacterium]|jgi:PHD/YefM family antitoxin component YafN of YafNO toxin-antitoxin module